MLICSTVEMSEFLHIFGSKCDVLMSYMLQLPVNFDVFKKCNTMWSMWIWTCDLGWTMLIDYLWLYLPVNFVTSTILYRPSAENVLTSPTPFKSYSRELIWLEIWHLGSKSWWFWSRNVISYQRDLQIKGTEFLTAIELRRLSDHARKSVEPSGLHAETARKKAE
jgi:hypothetical protein